ncbi:hypothetical protein IID26_01055 [Patescibacteria group bacterium]|nr:hypothetical protein [Patescibacteria group bacterium]
MIEFLSALSLGFLGITAETLGTILIAITVMNVHSHIIHERHIDMYVIKAMRKERRYVISGILLVILGYILIVIDSDFLF